MAARGEIICEHRFGYPALCAAGIRLSVDGSAASWASMASAAEAKLDALISKNTTLNAELREVLAAGLLRIALFIIKHPRISWNIMNHGRNA